MAVVKRCCGCRCFELFYIESNILPSFIGLKGLFNVFNRLKNHDNIFLKLTLLHRDMRLK